MPIRFERYGFLAASALLVIGFVTTGISDAQQGDKPTITMSPVANEGAGLPQIDGGQRQDPINWPATLKYFLKGEFACTSTIIGARVVITAAHCVDENAPVEVKMANGDQFHLTCSVHPKFDPDLLQADVALCLSDKEFSKNQAFENLDLRITHVRTATKLFLLGFGCRSVATLAEAGGQLYGGTATVIKLPDPSDDHIRTQGVKSNPDDAVICPGDSGGAAYVMNGSGATGPRSIVGMNSGYIAQTRVSAITSLTGITSDFVHDWSLDKKVSICGVHDNAQNCRDRFTP